MDDHPRSLHGSKSQGPRSMYLTGFFFCHSNQIMDLYSQQLYVFTKL